MSKSTLLRLLILAQALSGNVACRSSNERTGPPATEVAASLLLLAEPAATPISAEDRERLKQALTAPAASSPLVRATAAHCLGSIGGDPEFVEWLLAALADPNVNVRYDATIALTRLAEDDALSARRAAIASALIERIIDPLEHEIVRIKAAQGLANPSLANPSLAGSRTIEALINVLADNEANGIGYNAHLALIKITTQKLPRRAASWRAWYKAAPPAGAGS